MTKKNALNAWIVLIVLLALVSICSGRCAHYKSSLSTCKHRAKMHQQEKDDVIAHLQEQRVEIPIGWAMKMVRTSSKGVEVYGWMEGFYRPTTYIYRDTTITIVPSAEIPQGVRIFHEPDYSGLFTVLGTGTHVLKDLKFPPKTISSIKIPDGYMVTLYRQPSFMINSVTLTQSDGRLGQYNNILSLEIEEMIAYNKSVTKNLIILDNLL